MARACSLSLLLVTPLALVTTRMATAQTDPSAASPAAAAREHRLLLVLPFENRTGQANLDWIAEAVPEVLNQRLASAGFLPISRLDRQYALDHLGLTVNFQPSRATGIRIAQTLDADYIILGSYSLKGQRFTTTTQLLDVNSLHMGSAAAAGI